METKKELRNKILNIRNNMEKEDVLKKSNVILNKIVSSEIYKNSRTVFIYMDFKNEVITSQLINQMLKEKKRVVIPYTDIINTVIIPSEIKSMENYLTLSKFGYYEPIFEKIVPVNPQEFDLVVVPGVAFDKNLNRVGFGKGYYDKILKNIRTDAQIVAIAYEFQVLDEIPCEEHDIKMDKIITEETIYNKLL
ncbi:MAG: 5-formyltetrahydrofolate cyclo-ligase [Sedimentibacter sp.]|uniref:5-formyltetrahydrofolate cyclo-ligase n=1 Tax=Sedimentibacter sp. TaxID=1960295 RepID=UPI0029824972|nr:5-formyltetrahydrofolate cyclo-ligase [Sedimentibacter sp.]MDW5299480.1 5-formyltetrahydrofolate cyclo-ligase [Sedimentibacter sp.]